MDRFGKSLMIVSDRNVIRHYLSTGEEATVEAVHGGGGDRYARTFYVYVAFGRVRIHEHVHDATVLGALLYNIIANIFFPIGALFFPILNKC
jgi:hypothetical protein